VPRVPSGVSKVTCTVLFDEVCHIGTKQHRSASFWSREASSNVSYKLNCVNLGMLI
jgi:hypothetical protein